MVSIKLHTFPRFSGDIPLSTPLSPLNPPWLPAHDMRSVSVITTSALVASAAAQILNIAQVDKAVSSVLQTFAGYFHYDGSHLEGWRPTNPQTPADPSYWLADITHDGYAAFNPNASTYQVFRNVKDYGAKGNTSGINRYMYMYIYEPFVSVIPFRGRVLC